MFKKVLASALAFTFTATTFIASAAMAAAPVKLFVDGREIVPDVPAQIVDGRVMVPVRWVTEAMGAAVEWDESSRSVLITNNKQVGQEVSASVKGIWQGTLAFAGKELRILFHITAKPEGGLIAAMDSPDQGVLGVPMDKVTLTGNKLLLEDSSGIFVYEGEVKEAGNIIEGKLIEPREGVSLPLNLKKVNQAPQINRPQEPKKPYPYLEEEVNYENSKAGIKLAGTLTLPESGGPHPAVLLITGSGPQDRDETVFGHRPFLVLADYLTRQGIAVLRVDDRGVGSSTGDFELATSEDFAGDVLAGVKYLKGRKDIDPELIGLIGHSEGGMIASMAAAESDDVAYIIMMAGPGIAGEELLMLQAGLILEANGVAPATIAKNTAMQKAIFQVLRDEKDDAAAEKKILKIMTEQLQMMSEEERQALGYFSEAGLEQQAKMLLNPWFRYFLNYDPGPALKKVKVPVLAINGEKDLQVPPKENLGAIEEALRAGGNQSYTIVEMPGLNHAFQTVTSGSGLDYGKIEETLAPAALKVMGDWILQHIKDK